MERHIVICGDSRSMKDVKDKSVHLIITSPPYNVEKEYENFKDEKEYFKFLGQVLKECYRVLIKGGRLAINVPNAVASKTDRIKFISPKISQICKKIGFKEREWISWVKGKSETHFQGNNTAWGSWMSPSNPYMRPLSESILIFSKGSHKLIGDAKDIDITAEEFKEWTKNVWFIPNEYSSNHPCVFPEEMVKRLIKLYTYKGNTILDPFLGSGTTTVVARKLNRNSIGYEINPKYITDVKNRLNYNQKTLTNDEVILRDEIQISHKSRNR